MSDVTQFLDKSGLIILWDKICNTFASGEHTHKIVCTGNIPQLTASVDENGVLEFSVSETEVKLQGITDPPGIDPTTESAYVNPNDMQQLF